MPGIGISNAIPFNKGVSWSAYCTTLTDRFTTPPTSARKTLINDCLVKLGADGLLAKLDVLCLIGADAQCSLQNWVQDAYNATAYNSPTFVSDRYSQGDGISMYIDTNFNPTLGSIKYSRDSASWGLWSVAKSTSGTYNGQAAIGTLLRTDTGVGWVNNGPSGGMNCGELNPGMGTVVRIDSTHLRAHKNQNYPNGESVASVAVVNTTFKIFSYGGAAIYNNSKIAGWYIGASLTDTDVSNLYSAINTYLVAIGAA